MREKRGHIGPSENSLPGGGTESPGAPSFACPSVSWGSLGSGRSPLGLVSQSPGHIMSLFLPLRKLGFSKRSAQMNFRVAPGEVWTPLDKCAALLHSSLSQHFSFLSRTMSFLGDTQPRRGCSAWLKEGPPNCPRHRRSSGEPHPVPARVPQGTIICRVPAPVHSTSGHWVQAGCVG